MITTVVAAMVGALTWPVVKGLYRRWKHRGTELVSPLVSSGRVRQSSKIRVKKR